MSMIKTLISSAISRSADAAPFQFVVVEGKAVQTSSNSRNLIGAITESAISRRSESLPVRIRENP